MTEFLVEVHIGTERKRHEQDYKALTFGAHFVQMLFPMHFWPLLATFETSLERFGAKYISLSVCKFLEMTICRITSLTQLMRNEMS